PQDNQAVGIGAADLGRERDRAFARPELVVEQVDVLAGDDVRLVRDRDLGVREAPAEDLLPELRGDRGVVEDGDPERVLTRHRGVLAGRDPSPRPEYRTPMPSP